MFQTSLSLFDTRCFVRADASFTISKSLAQAFSGIGALLAFKDGRDWDSGKEQNMFFYVFSSLKSAGWRTVEGFPI